MRQFYIIQDNLPFYIEQIMLKTQPQQKSSVHLANSYSSTSPDLNITSAFLKKQISKIIKEELKTYGLRNKLESQLQTNHKHQINKHLLKSLFDDKMTAFKTKEQSLRRKKQDDFIKKQQEREQRLKEFQKSKHQFHQQKFKQIKQELSQVNEKHRYLVTADSNLRLSKLKNFDNQRSNPHCSMSHTSSRVQSRSNSVYQRQTVKELSQKQEKQLITNYLKKIEKSESRILLKEMDNEKRIQTSKNSRVKCLVEQRNKMEVDRMDKVEKQYSSRMEHFAASRQKVYRFKQTVQMNRSSLNFNKYRLAVHKRQQIKAKEMFENESKLENAKEKIFQQYRACLDITNNHRNMKNNLNKMKAEEKQAKIEKAMKLLTQKLQKIRNVRYGQKLDDNSLKIVLSMLDRSDPQYKAIVQFLKCERQSYLEGVIQKEQERTKFDKSKKTNKLLSKTTTL